jgi:hypothetical protein
VAGSNHVIFFVLNIPNLKFRRLLINKQFSLMLMLISSVSYATITPINDLSFGTIVVLDNNSIGQISIGVDNQINFTNQLRVLNSGQRGEYFISDYPAFTQIFISTTILASNTNSPAPSSEQFTLSALSTEPSIYTNASGEGTVFVGGVLQTSGVGGLYYDTGYSVIYRLTVNF